MSTTRAMVASLASLVLGCAPGSSAVMDVAPHQAGTFADSVRSADATLHGTLIVSANARPPVALIISGSGPTDRDGNSLLLPGKNNSLRYLAEALAERGIATLRYDKRGIGQSRKVVSIAGAGAPAGDVIIRQLSAQLPPPLLAQATDAVHKLERGALLDTVPPGLLALFRPSVQPYLISWFKHDPAVAASRLGIPLLVVHGTHDIQAVEEDARAIAAGNPSATLTRIQGMNHVLKQTPAGRTEQIPAYGDSTLVIDPTLVDAIAGFILRPRN